MPVFAVEIGDDLRRLVHLGTGVGIDQERELLPATERADLFPIALAALRTRPDENLEIEPCRRLANATAERARLELVEHERLLGLHAGPNRTRAGTTSEPTRHLSTDEGTSPAHREVSIPIRSQTASVLRSS